MSGNVAPCFSAIDRNCSASFTHHVAVERSVVCHPKAVEDREQQQRVFEMLSERLGLFDQSRASIHSPFGFWRGIAFDCPSGFMSAT